MLFQRLKENNANPVFMLRHIKDIKSPITVASAKHAMRRDRRPANAGAGLDRPPAMDRQGVPMARPTRLHHPPVLLPLGKDKEGENGVEDDSEKPPVSPREAPGYCISIYPYLAEREDEFDVAVGDSASLSFSSSCQPRLALTLRRQLSSSSAKQKAGGSCIATWARTARRTSLRASPRGCRLAASLRPPSRRSLSPAPPIPSHPTTPALA